MVLNRFSLIMFLFLFGISFESSLSAAPSKKSTKKPEQVTKVKASEILKNLMDNQEKLEKMIQSLAEDVRKLKEDVSVLLQEGAYSQDNTKQPSLEQPLEKSLPMTIPNNEPPSLEEGMSYKIPSQQTSPQPNDSHQQAPFSENDPQERVGQNVISQDQRYQSAPVSPSSQPASASQNAQPRSQYY